MVTSSTMAYKAVANSSVEEKSFHNLALMPYVARHSPVHHRWGAMGAGATCDCAAPSSAKFPAVVCTSIFAYGAAEAPA